jgi:biopolymer transport protein ExbD
MRRPSTPLFSKPNVFPFLGTLLVVLIIFMVITPPLCSKGVTVELAKVKNWRYLNGADREDSVIIMVERDGKLYFDTEQVAPDSSRDSNRYALARAMTIRRPHAFI